jgi:uncharacterized membrane protein YgcG
MSHFRVLLAARRQRAEFMSLVAGQHGFNSSIDGGWNYGAVSDYDAWPNCTTVFRTPRFFLSSSVSPFLVGASIGAATGDEDAVGETLRFRVICIWRVLQLVEQRWPLARFAREMMGRAAEFVAMTDAETVPANRSDPPALYSAVKRGLPMWLLALRASSLPALPSMRIQFPNHTLGTLTRSLAEAMRALGTVCPPHVDVVTNTGSSSGGGGGGGSSGGGGSGSAAAIRRKRASNRAGLIASYALFELCHYTGGTLEIEYTEGALEARLGITAEDFQGLHRLVEEEASRITAIELPGPGFGAQAFYISTEGKGLPEVYFIRVADSNWLLWANNPDPDFPLTTLPEEFSWEGFLRSSVRQEDEILDSADTGSTGRFGPQSGAQRVL